MDVMVAVIAANIYWVFTLCWALCQELGKCYLILKINLWGRYCYPILQMRKLRFREMETPSVPLRTETRIWAKPVWLFNLDSSPSGGIVTLPSSRAALPGVALEGFVVIQSYCSGNQGNGREWADLLGRETRQEKGVLRPEHWVLSLENCD